MGVGQYDLLKNVQPTDNTVLNTLTVNKITTLDDTQLVGDIVSHEYKFTFPAATAFQLNSGYTLAFSLPDVGIVPASFCDVDVYELVYMGRDPRAGDNLVQMSATLFIPQATSKGYVTSTKHGYIPYNNPSYTARGCLELLVNEVVDVPTFITGGLAPYGFNTAALGSITVVSDMIGWGVTRGPIVSVDKDANVQSEVGAIVATRKLMVLNPDGIFDQFYTLADPVTSIDVLLFGYSMGALSGPSRAAELQQYQDEYKVNVKLLKTDGVIIPPIATYLANGTFYPIKSTTTTFVPNALFIPAGILFLPILGWGNAWDTASGGVLDSVFKEVIINFMTARNTLYNEHTVPVFAVQDQIKFLYDLIYYLLNYLEYTDPADPATVIIPWAGYPGLQPSIDPEDPGYILTLPLNPYYIFKRDAYKYSQILANVCDYSSISNVPTVNLGGIPIVSMCSNLDEYCTTPYINTAGSVVVVNSTVPQLFKSYCTGSVIANNKNFMFSGYVPDPANAGYYLPDSSNGSIWYQKAPGKITPAGPVANPHYNQVVVPTTIDRNVSKYSENLNTTVNTTQACNDIANAIIATIGTDNCKLYMANTTGLPYSSHTYFSIYTVVCIDALIVQGYNP
jgi:hypothetical protein